MIRPSIRQQTLLISLLPMLLAVILLDSYFLYSRFTSLEEGMVERAQLLAKQIGSGGEYALFSGNTEQVQKDVTTALKQKDVAVAAIRDMSGKVVAYAGDAISDAESEIIKAYGASGVISDTPNYFWVREPIASPAIDLNDLDTISDNAATRLLGHVLIKMHKGSLQKEKWKVLWASSLISMLLLGLTLFFVLRVSRRIVNPIEALNHLAHGIGGGALDMRLAFTPRIRELGELALGINEMANQLQKDRAVLEGQTELLRASEERLNEIISTMPAPLFIKDAQSRITLMNSACEAQWGVLFANMLGTDGGRFFPAQQLADFLANDKAVFEGRKMVDFEESVWNAEIKEYRTLHTFKKPIYDQKGMPLYLIGISVDISERKLAEIRLGQLNEQLEMRIEAATRESRLKKEDAENANYDKTRFLAAASHDLRQPMHALGLFVGELHSKLTTPEQRKIVGKVEESVDALSNLLDALLDISKLDAGVVAPSITAFAVGDMFERIARDYVPLAERKGISLRVIPNSAVADTDPILLERILVNLISNAIRYTPIGGRVVVAGRSRGDKLGIEVRDNGIGIPRDEQKKIFREFVQLANRERDRSKGLGLGLAIVDRIAKLLNYDIKLRSEPGKGSTFAVYVPKINASMAQATPPSAVQDETAGPRAPSGFDTLDVLVVDDDPLVRKSTQGIVESWGCHVSMAASLNEAKEIHSKAEFDLVICDYRLPDGNGIEMADWIAAHFKARPLFILISGDTSPEVLQMVNERGIQLLHKPVRPAKLRSLIQFLINQKTPG
ncbi:MAG: response regulator [Gallionellaceae bacterium]|nr:MAG: response regulator [Gallionellaceae bacterium]